MTERPIRVQELECVISDLSAQLRDMEKQKNGAYAERNKLVSVLSKVFPASIEKHEGTDWEDDWRNVVFITLPTGQVSWHIHDSELPLFRHLKSKGTKWDGHTTEEKYARCIVFDSASVYLVGVDKTLG